ncbi:MAG: hypothetical protein Q8O27_00880 [Enterobacteriaceae bacterium]|nr:hypothetical protein [Enterobacteriaceae bacterium]
MTFFNILINTNKTEQRIDNFISKTLNLPSKSYIYKQLRKKKF